MAGNVVPSYEVAGDWFDVVENPDGMWVTLADGLGGGTRAIASARWPWARCERAAAAARLPPRRSW